MGLKEDLASVHNAIKRDRFDDAISKANELIQRKPDTFQAHLFLAFALDKKSRFADSEQAYITAARLKPNDVQPWQGLVRLYESQGDPRLRDAVVSLARIFAEKDDVNKCQETYVKFLDHVRKTGDTASIVGAYSLVLPDGPLYELLEGRVLYPALIYERIIPLIESDETKRINTMIGERRTRIGAKLGDVTLEVKRDVYEKSQLEHLLRQAIIWTRDDDKRREYEERLIRYCHEKMVVSPPGPKKVEAAQEVYQLCQGMVIIKHPFQLSWEIVIDWKDATEISQWDVTVLREYCVLFPDSDLTKLLRGFLTSTLSPFPPEPPAEPDPAEGGHDVEPPEMPMTEEERLDMMAEGITGAKSLLGYRLMGEYYQHLEDHESLVELMQNAVTILEKERTKTGFLFQETDSAYSILLATAQVYYQAPRHHREALALFEKVLERTPSSTAALIGVGLIYEEEEDYDQAIDFLDRALARDDSSLRVRVEAAWVRALRGDFSTALAQLQESLALFDPETPLKGLRARALYGVGYCLWHLDASRGARKRRSGAYAYFLDSLKSDLDFAPSYTMLGIYYAEYARDSKRAVRCFQKAVELSASEVQAAEHLARLFANDSDWDRVELVARRVVDSGKVKPPPGSKKRGISWPFAALGVAELNKQDFHKAIVSFQAALRISPSDYHSWVGLGESYYSSGRYMAAAKAIVNAQKLQEDAGGGDAVVVCPEDAWFTKYLLANVNRELGDYDEAIVLYRAVIESRPDEQGVALALLQTMVENAQYSVERGYYGKGVQLTLETIGFAATFRDALQETFNYWKAVGDACAIFTFVQARVGDFPADDVQRILASDSDEVYYSALADIDKVGTAVVFASGKFPEDEEFGVDLTRCLHATLLAYKRAAHVSIRDIYAQSAAYYNLGWAEYRAHSCLPRSLRGRYSRHLRAAVAAFKRAIELESGNSEFWNALGVVTGRINPAVSQHAFVRSLVLNERSAAAWTNLGTLALSQSDVELANEAYTRAQSTDPDYAHAWVGQSLIASLMGDGAEAYALLTHAMEISESSSVATRRHYSTAVFDRIVSSPATGTGVIPLLGPLLAVSQLQALQPQDHPSAHLASLLHERVGNTSRAMVILEDICAAAEADFEATESADALARFALAKTDIARAYLGIGRLDDAMEAAGTALDLSSDEADNELTASQRQKARLSANLTIGLARYYEHDVDESVANFQAALGESAGDSDAACLLAQVLWATGGDENRRRARTVLNGVAREAPTHVQCNVLLSVMALLSNDKSAMAFAQRKLESLRTMPGAVLSDAEHARICAVTRAMALRLGGQQGALVQAQTEILMAPYRSHGWAVMGEADMALKVAERAVKAAGRRDERVGPAEADELSRTLSRTGRAGDAQKAIILAPWEPGGWHALARSVAG